MVSFNKITLVVSAMVCFSLQAQTPSAESGIASKAVGADSLNITKVVDSVTTTPVVPVVIAKRSISIKTTPDSATIVFDSMGVDAKTPATIDSVTIGEHTVILKKEGYFLKKAKINVSADSNNIFEFNLVRPGALYFNSTPAGAEIVLDGKKIGITPLLKNKLKPGTYAVTYSLLGFESMQKSVTVADGTTDTISVVMAKMVRVPLVESTKEPLIVAKNNSIGRIIVTGLFVVFGLGILIAELVGP